MLAVKYKFLDYETPRAELGLIYAILETAITDYLKPSIDKYVAECAEIWLFEDDHHTPFAAGWICDHLHLELAAIRRNIKLLEVVTEKIKWPKWQWSTVVDKLLCQVSETATNNEIYVDLHLKRAIKETIAKQ